jgi:hypothetical protein
VQCFDTGGAGTDTVWRRVVDLTTSPDRVCVKPLRCFGAAVATWGRAVAYSGKINSDQSVAAYVTVGYAPSDSNKADGSRWNCTFNCPGTSQTAFATNFLTSTEPSYGDSLALAGTLLLVGAPQASAGASPVLSPVRIRSAFACPPPPPRSLPPSLPPSLPSSVRPSFLPSCTRHRHPSRRTRVDAPE